MEYGSTDLTDGIAVAGLPLTDGDKRLVALLVTAFGPKHPAIDDLVALLFRARPAAAVPMGDAEPTQPRYRCSKCGYTGPEQINHQRPNGTGMCGYIAAKVMTNGTPPTPPNAPPNGTPPAPPECETEAEKTAFSFGYWQGLHALRREGEVIERDGFGPKTPLRWPTDGAQEPSK